MIFSPSNEAKSAPGTKLNRDREDDEEGGEEENTGFTSFLASWLGDEWEGGVGIHNLDGIWKLLLPLFCEKSTSFWLLEFWNLTLVWVKVGGIGVTVLSR